ncbi:hypothetical protein, partial [Lunatimonas salinarum]|uniref:hypothetical protein n=1 Tax=Lunatimonas salinarum TaxID=1774590 RepID=UPI001ADF44F3
RHIIEKPFVKSKGFFAFKRRLVGLDKEGIVSFFLPHPNTSCNIRVYYPASMFFQNPHSLFPS